MVIAPLLGPNIALAFAASLGDSQLMLQALKTNLSAKLVFLFKGVRPRTWLEKNRARQSVTICTTFWILSLLILIVAIMLRHGFYT
jgi:uncharacterized membrane protein